MPVTFDLSGSILTLTMVGEYPPAEIRRALAAGLESAGAVSITGLLLDLRRSHSVTRRTLGDVTSIVGHLVYHAKAYGQRVAIVASSDVAYGLARIADVDFDGGGVASRTFRDLPDALDWLKLGADARVS